MKYIGHTTPIILVADEGKGLVAISEPVEEQVEGAEFLEQTHEEVSPTSVVFLADGTTEAQAYEMYEEVEL